MYIKYILCWFKPVWKAYHLSFLIEYRLLYIMLHQFLVIQHYELYILGWSSLISPFQHNNNFNSHISFRQDGWCHLLLLKTQRFSFVMLYTDEWRHGNFLLTNDYTWAWHSFPSLPLPDGHFLPIQSHHLNSQFKNLLLDGQFVPGEHWTVTKRHIPCGSASCQFWYCKHCFWMLSTVGQPRHSRLQEQGSWFNIIYSHKVLISCEEFWECPLDSMCPC